MNSERYFSNKICTQYIYSQLGIQMLIIFKCFNGHYLMQPVVQIIHSKRVGVLMTVLSARTKPEETIHPLGKKGDLHKDLCL